MARSDDSATGGGIIEFGCTFYNRWNFLNYVGTIDGGLILLQALTNFESSFPKCKITFSMVLMAVVGKTIHSQWLVLKGMVLQMIQE